MARRTWFAIPRVQEGEPPSFAADLHHSIIVSFDGESFRRSSSLPLGCLQRLVIKSIKGRQMAINLPKRQAANNEQTEIGHTVAA